ncbi:Up-regulated during septation-domain-containing protein [Fusarium oxysporum Fo47]|uniref:Up-regulated during septation-domain-containing protein n=1 Tax=Fusarium oxysporum Fo47 TaxID=660027 RepID=UPI002869A158|nr:Up-regulated during septation-domain-containing protein [Fusarium oxysporum Fo47]QKD57063.2 Up-regulated during septation-domain-containing protein [Fusarium oxysporum Fo47]
MAHIAEYIVSIDVDHITRPPSQSSNDLPDPPRKYQFFPQETRLPVLNSRTKGVDVEKAISTPSLPTSDRIDKLALAPSGLTKRLNQYILVRQRKISVPELGPMTAVQELAIDSPAIPGRPTPSHARSTSVPNNSFGEYQLTDTFLYISSDDKGSQSQSLGKEAPQACSQGIATVSPKCLDPPVNPKSDVPLPLLQRLQSLNYFTTRNESPRHGRINGSPQSRTASIPKSSMPDLTAPKSASTNATSCGTPATPVLAPLMEPNAAYLNLRNGSYTPPTITTEVGNASRGHRRGDLESSGTMGRGLPREGSGLGTNNDPFVQRPESRRGKSLEQKAFEPLPIGLKQADAFEQLEQSELTLLQKKAFDQELRHLDERIEYLRHTYNALRIGRRNLHSRICQYLRSSSIAKFSHELLLKQEEVLASLDASIDDWVMKLEQAENRQTRVHQKLLEHIAAAACLPVGGLTTTPEPQQTNTPASSTGDISTPLRSPSKEIFASARPLSTSPSPQRAVARVLSTVAEQSIIGKIARREPEQHVTRTASPNRADVEIICIYAGDNLAVSPLALPPTTQKNEPIEGAISLLSNFV